MSDFTWTWVPAANDAVSDNDVIIDEKVRKMRLTLLDRDLDTERPCTLEEARTWPWSESHHVVDSRRLADHVF